MTEEQFQALADWIEALAEANVVSLKYRAPSIDYRQAAVQAEQRARDVFLGTTHGGSK